MGRSQPVLERENSMRGSRILIAAVAALALAGCSTTGGSSLMLNAYTAKTDGAYKLPAIPVSKIKRQYRRQIVSYQTKEKPGTIIVDTKAKHFVLRTRRRQGRALRHRGRSRGLYLVGHGPG